MSEHLIEAIVLGTAQDGGIPQIGCNCPRCRAAREDEIRRRWVSCLGLIDRQADSWWLVDATPDIERQVGWMATHEPGARLAGILLTHAHIGHYLGLAFLGREAWDTHETPVVCTDRMAAFLERHEPWRQLIDRSNIELHRSTAGLPIQLSQGLTATAVAVPHRDELSDTVAWSFAGRAKRLVYCPDIDRWEGTILEVIREADIALLDGTFGSADELPGRDRSSIPHPCIENSVRIFEMAETEIVFTHLNHSNPLADDGALAETLRREGFTVARRGDRWSL